MRKYLWLLNIAYLTCTGLAFAEPIAGELSKKQEQDNPYIFLNPEHNVTDIIDISPAKDSEPDIYFTADELIANDKDKTIEATGDVVISRDNLKVFTDRIIYNQKNDTITAIGNVELHEADGMRIYADEVNLTSKLTRAEMDKIKVIMRDESKLWADHFH